MDITGIADVKEFGKNLGTWADELRADPRDQLSPGDVLSALQNLRIDARITNLPGALGKLLGVTKTRVSDLRRGKEASNFIKSGLLHDIEDTMFALAEADMKRCLSHLGHLAVEGTPS